jgi:hypothetical protein
MKVMRGGGLAPFITNLDTMKVSGVPHASAALPSAKNSRCPLKSRLDASRAGLNAMGGGELDLLPLSAFQPVTVASFLLYYNIKIS